MLSQRVKRVWLKEAFNCKLHIGVEGDVRIATESVIELNLELATWRLLRNFDLIIFFLMRRHFATADFFFSSQAQLHIRRLCTFVPMETYLSEIGCCDHLWKSFAYA